MLLRYKLGNSACHHEMARHTACKQQPLEAQAQAAAAQAKCCACLHGFCLRNLSLIAVPACLQGDADSQQRSDTAGDAHNTYIWGTRLVIADMQAKIRRFLRDFKREGTSNALYVTLIMQVGLSGWQQRLRVREAVLQDDRRNL